jgi:hypothetical protein
VLRIFIGYDERQSVAYNVCRYSIERRSSVPVAITPLKLDTLPLKREGLTRFTFSRFLVPWLCNYEGRAIFMDSDFLCLDDIAQMSGWGLPGGGTHPVYVRKSDHKFEWASLIDFDCGHPSNKILTPDYVATANDLHRLSWLKDDEIGDISKGWNHLVGYDEPWDHASLVHFTQGLPIFPETEGSEYAEQWRAEHKAMNSTKPWQETMGNSVHAAMTKDGRRVARLHKDAINT